MNAINILPGFGPSLPIGIRKEAAARVHVGKADPIWGTLFTTKFSRKPKADAKMVTPIGAQNVIDRFVSRAAELDYLINTQHKELATTQQTLKANGIACISLSQSFQEDHDPTEITDAMLAIIDVMIDPTALATMKRKIEWEQSIWNSGPVHGAKFEPTPDGKLGVAYIGAKKFRDSAEALAVRKALKYDWLDRFGVLPTLDELDQMHAFADYYGGKTVMARMTKEEFDADTNSRRFGTEDPDPGRIVYHAENPRTVVWEEDRIDGEPNGMITADLPGGMIDVGYAGPKGFLGLDDEFVNLDDEFEYFAGDSYSMD